jgi:hypothetical protein
VVLNSKELRSWLEAPQTPLPPALRAAVEAPRKGNGEAHSEAAGILPFRAASELLARASLASAAGLTFGGKRDLYAALGYPRTLTPKDYRERYERGDIAARVVEAYPKATWRGGAELVEDPDPDIPTDFEEAWRALAKRLSVWSAFSRADILAGLGDFSVLLIGAVGALDSELPTLGGPEGILYLAPYGPDEVSIDRYEESSENPRYGLPLMYRLRRTSTTSTRRTLNTVVHWTRVLHVAQNLLDDDVTGRPLLGRVWNRLDDLDKVVGSGSEAFWMRVHPGTVFSINPELKVGEDEIKKFKEQVDEYMHGMRRYLAARGIDTTMMGADTSNFEKQVGAIISLISGSTGIPQRILLGSERGELASTEDKENWNERVRDRRDEFGDPIVRTFVDRCVVHGALPEPEQYEVRWPDIDDLTETERAEIADKWSKLNGQAGGVVVQPEEIRDRILLLPKLEVPTDGGPTTP